MRPMRLQTSPDDSRLREAALRALFAVDTDLLSFLFQNTRHPPPQTAWPRPPPPPPGLPLYPAP